MASATTHAHIEAQARLRDLVVAAIGSQWQSLVGYDEDDVPVFVAAASAIALAGQRQAAALVNAYLARMLRRLPLPLDVTQVTGAAVRNGTTPEQQWRRPFVNVWTALGNGAPYEDALAAGLARARGMAADDIQLAARATYGQVAEADTNIYGFQRTADGNACAFCREVDGAYVKHADALALHTHCGCGLEPLTAPHRRAVFLPSGVAVHEHGELGLVLGSPDHNFTSL